MFNTKSKIGLAVAMTLASASATAQVNLNAATPDVYNLAQESTIASTGTAVADVVDLDIVHDIGFGFSDNTPLFLRYELSNGAEFTALPTAPAGDIDAVTVSSGTAGDSILVYSFNVNNAAGIAPTADITLVSNGVTVENNSDVSVTVSLYDDATAASTGGTAISTITGTYLDFIASGSVAFVADATAPVAEVSGGFLGFVAGTDEGAGVALGTAAHTVTEAATAILQANELDGTNITNVNTIYSGTSSLVITGDFAAAADADGDFTTATALARVHLQVGGCATTGTSASAVTATSATFTGALAANTAATTVCYDPNGTTAIPASGYTASWTGATNAGFTAPAATAGTLASISRNGTNVDIPYITTFSDYNQRIVLVNRSTADATYVITFTPESSVTATAGSAATGTIAAGETLIVRVTDVVSLSGGTRTAGFISIVAPSGQIDVATTQVNLSDASTDTVVLQ